ASEVKALLQDADLPRRLNLATLDTYLSFGYMIGEETLYEGVRRLPPGHALVVGRGSQRLLRHWTPRFPPASERPHDPAAIALETCEGLPESERHHLRSDRPLGLLMRGGMDSAGLLESWSQMAPGSVRTSSVGYDVGRGAANPDDEPLQARRIATHFGADHHE